MKAFELIKYWIFDLDNTLYSGKTKVFEQVDKKMSKYISEKLNLPDVFTTQRNGGIKTIFVHNNNEFALISATKIKLRFLAI